MNKLTTKNIIALTIGHAFEWYDFFIYSFTSIYFAKLFFPAINPVNSILASTATFGAALLMRPLGGIILGAYSDQYGRIRTMNVIILIMTVSLLFIIMTPTYHQIGIIAPLLILFARLLQGFSTGAEFAVSASVLIELAPQNKRGFYSSMQTFGQMIAVLLSSFIGMMLASHLSTEQIESGGWRIPFLLGLLIAPAGIYIRYKLSEPNTAPIQKRPVTSYIHIVKENIKSILIVTGAVSGGTVSMYVILSYMPIYATNYLHLTAHDSYLSVLIAVGLMTLFIPFFGWLSDIIGKKSLLLFALTLYFVELYPCFMWLNTAPSLMRLIIVQCIFCFSLAIYYGAITAAMTELFPKNIRSICLSIGFNIGVMIFGTFAQLIVTFLIEMTRSPMAITIYPLVGIGVCLIAISFYPDTIDSTEDSRALSRAST